MKKFLALMLALMMALSLVACGNDAPPADDGVADDGAVVENTYNTLTPGVLTVATSPDFAPYEFYVVDENGEYQLAGFDMALAQYIADYLGLKLEVIPMDFDGTLAELAAKTVDLSLAGYSPDPSRMDKMDFSEIYYTGGQSFVTVKANADKFPSLEATNDPQWTIGAQNGSIQMDLANENSPEADIVALTKVTDIIAELIAGKLDGAYIETAVAESYKVNYPDLHIVCDVPYDVEGSAVGVIKGNDALLAGVNAAIAAALADGSMDKFVAEANEQAVGNIYEGLLEG